MRCQHYLKTCATSSRKHRVILELCAMGWEATFGEHGPVRKATGSCMDSIYNLNLPEHDFLLFSGSPSHSETMCLGLISRLCRMHAKQLCLTYKQRPGLEPTQYHNSSNSLPFLVSMHLWIFRFQDESHGSNSEKRMVQTSEAALL